MLLMGRRWVHLVLGGALLMPFFLLTSVVVPLLADGANPFLDVGWQFVAFGGALPLAALAALLFPLLRPLEVAAVRSLCGVPAERLAEGRRSPGRPGGVRRCGSWRICWPAGSSAG
ncbi:hypothetical protein Srufu_059950 [Streptomyces libani subsp. rufus]|nr:hypothetical protein Srufu_059950 [Streptomyces libani subsp. rufus]